MGAYTSIMTSLIENKLSYHVEKDWKIGVSSFSFNCHYKVEIQNKLK